MAGLSVIDILQWFYVHSDFVDTSPITKSIN